MLAKHALSQLSYGPVGKQRTEDKTTDKRLSALCRPSSVICRPILVGLGGLEPPTSRLSSARSNQLSYKPGRKQARPARQNRTLDDANRLEAARASTSGKKRLLFL